MMNLKNDNLNLKPIDPKEIHEVKWKTISELKLGNFNRDIKQFLNKMENMSLYKFYLKYVFMKSYKPITKSYKS
jgi:hypothetical protein